MQGRDIQITRTKERDSEIVRNRQFNRETIERDRKISEKETVQSDTSEPEDLVLSLVADAVEHAHVFM